MDTLKSLIQPLVGGGGSSSVVDGMKLVVLGGTVETARRVSSSAWSHFVNSFFLTAHFSEEDYPFDWLMLWLSRRPEWQRSREFETTTRSSGPGGATSSSFDDWDMDEREHDNSEYDTEGRPKTRVVFQPTFDTTHTIFYRGHWLRVRRSRKPDGCEQLSISVVARSNTVLKQLVLQAKREYEAEAIHRIQIYFADSHGSWRWTDSRHKRPMASIVLNPGVKEMLLEDTKDFLRSEKWYADRGIPFRRGYLLHGVPGSGKSSLIHALAGALQLDIYVVSLSASWISDSTLTTLMGRVPARCVVLLEDLDAAFTRNTSRDDFLIGDKDKDKKDGDSADKPAGPHVRRRRDNLSDVNTLSLSGLLNALDGVAAAEGRLLFATTNHLEKLDTALSRPGRMDVWIEFRNATKWQAEALFRNFFPCVEDEPPVNFDDDELEGLDMKVEVEDGPSMASKPTLSRSSSNSVSRPTSCFTPTAATFSLPSPASSPSPSSLTSGVSSLWSLASTATSRLASPFGSCESETPSPGSSTPPTKPSAASKSNTTSDPAKLFSESEQFGASNTAYRPPPPEDNVLNSRHTAVPLDKNRLNELAKKFADGIPEEEFSVADLQGYLLKNKAHPELAANGVVEWVDKERKLRERLKKEKVAREQREKALRERRRREFLEKAQEEKELKKREVELERVKQRLADKEKDEELERMRQQLKEKEEDLKKKAEALGNKEDTATITPETKTDDITIEEEDLDAEGEIEERIETRRGLSANLGIRLEESDVDDEVVPQSSSSEWSEA